MPGSLKSILRARPQVARGGRRIVAMLEFLQHRKRGTESPFSVTTPRHAGKLSVHPCEQVRQAEGLVLCRQSGSWLLSFELPSPIP